MTMIYVGNLSDDTDAARVWPLFERYGIVASLRLTPGASARRFDGFGLIEMEESAARRAIAELDGRLLNGAILSVHEAKEPPPPDVTRTVTETPPDDEPPRAIMSQRFEVIEMEKVDGPGNADGDDWYRYVLARGRSRITGFHRGTWEEVSAYAAECAEAYRERNQRRKASRPLAPPRKK
jgi:RNA recognition motif-containing protein